MTSFRPNAYDGFRPSQRTKNGRIQVFVSVRGGGEALEDVLVYDVPDDVEHRAHAQVTVLLLEAICVALNVGWTVDHVKALVNQLAMLGDKYQVQLPPGWKLLMLGYEDLEPQWTFSHEYGQCVIVQQDTYTEECPIEALMQDGEVRYVRRWPQASELLDRPDLPEETSDS